MNPKIRAPDVGYLELQNGGHAAPVFFSVYPSKIDSYL